MAVSPIRAHPADDSWRMAGCGERCRAWVIVQQGRHYPERMVCHDPHHHEAYGEFALASRRESPVPRTVETGPLLVDSHSLRVTVAGREIVLPVLQRTVLFCLAAQAGGIVSRHELLITVWGPEYSVLGPLPSARGRRDAETQMIRALMFRLRAALGPAGRLVETVPALGYCLRMEPVQGGSDA